MSIAIVTRPRMENYGGILQHYALQQVLKELGHDPVTIDYQPTLAFKWYFRGILRMLVKGVPYRKFFLDRPAVYDAFVKEHIRTTPVVRCYRKRLLRDADAVIVGSDQVWRYLYNKRRLPDMFLRFGKGFKVRKVVYAASFGTGTWDAPEKVRGLCSRLSKQFDCVSVREDSGVSTCREHLHREAVQMPDPVLLLTASDYLDLCKDVPKDEQGFILSYLLDENPVAEERVNELQKQTGLPVKRCSGGSSSELSIPEWIALFRDARYVITDSYHGLVFSRLFEKPYTLFENEERGSARYRQITAVADLKQEYMRGRSFLKEALLPASE